MGLSDSEKALCFWSDRKKKRALIRFDLLQVYKRLMVNPFQDIGSFAQDGLLFRLVYYMPQIFTFLSTC